MLRKKAEMASGERVALRGGSGAVQTLELLTSEELMGKGRMFSVMTLEPGCSIGLHEHIGEAEIYYILKGTGLATDDGQHVIVEAGDILYTGNGHSHSISNESRESLEFLAVILLQ